jgi:hypothetical protein
VSGGTLPQARASCAAHRAAPPLRTLLEIALRGRCRPFASRRNVRTRTPVSGPRKDKAGWDSGPRKDKAGKLEFDRSALSGRAFSAPNLSQSLAPANLALLFLAPTCNAVGWRC